MPVSLREGFNSVRRRSQVTNPWALLNLDLSVPVLFGLVLVLVLVLGSARSALPLLSGCHPVPPTRHRQPTDLLRLN
jgi:hypothetical protein